MQFGEQIKAARKELGLTQEQMATQLGISRQAVSNWENNRNLPDIEMLILLACTFHLSLDDLILGGRNMTSTNTTVAPQDTIKSTPIQEGGMAQKLINDGSETRRSKWVAMSACVGAGLLVIGVGFFIAATQLSGQVDANGMLYENLYLPAFGLLFFFAGLIAFLSTGVKAIKELAKDREAARSHGWLKMLVVSVVVAALLVVFFVALILNNMLRS